MTVEKQYTEPFFLENEQQVLNEKTLLVGGAEAADPPRCSPLLSTPTAEHKLATSDTTKKFCRCAHS